MHEGLVEHNAKEFPQPVHFGGPRQFEQNLCNSECFLRDEVLSLSLSTAWQIGLNTKWGSSNGIIPCFATLEKEFRHQRQNISKFC